MWKLQLKFIHSFSIFMCGSLLGSAGIWGNGCPPFWALPFPSAPPLFRFFGDMRLIQANYLAGSYMAFFQKMLLLFFQKMVPSGASPKRFCAEWQLPPKHFAPSGTFPPKILRRVEFWSLSKMITVISNPWRGFSCPRPTLCFATSWRFHSSQNPNLGICPKCWKNRIHSHKTYLKNCMVVCEVCCPSQSQNPIIWIKI